MPSRGGRRRTDSQSQAFKSEIIRLRGEKKSIVEIGKQLHVSRQYVSSVLIEAGLRGRSKLHAKEEAEKGNIEKDIYRLEQEDEHTLANWLRVWVQRRKK